MGLISELRRRNVLRMAVLYVVAAWLIMQVTEVLMALTGLPLWSGRAVLAVLVTGLPIALVFSWFYELTPEGVSLEKDIRPDDSIAHITGRRLDFIVISLLAGAVILFAYDKWWTSPPAQSIAVLAFENMSADKEQEYFSDGVSEELLNLLAQIPDLRVISRSSAFSFKGKDVAIPTIARQLNVAHVLEGSVRRTGDRVRITAQLIDASSDSHLWSQSFDRELGSTFAVQNEIAVAVVEAIKGHLNLSGTPRPRRHTTADPEAHDAYLMGRYLVVQRTRTSIEGAVREFEKAIALDPGYALAHAELAMAISMIGGPDYVDWIAKITTHVEQAMVLDPTLAEVHAANGLLLMVQWQYESALPHLERSIQINPNYSVVYSWMSVIYRDLGRYKESFAMLETSARLDPLSIVAIQNYALGLIDRNRLADAERAIGKLQSLSPFGAARVRGALAALDGKWANLVLSDLDALRLEPESRDIRRYLYNDLAILGLEKEALAVRARPSPWLLSVLGRSRDAVEAAEALVAEQPTRPYARYMLGQTLAMVGDYARAHPMQEDVWREAGGRVTRLGAVEAIDAAALVAIRRSVGDEEGADEIVAAIKDNVRRYREAGIVNGPFRPVRNRPDFEDGLAYFLDGERERGLALIAKAVQDGDFVWPNVAYLQELYDDPGFVPIRALQEARQARERKRFLAVVCADSPYAAVWQPEDGTCEAFIAAGSI